MKTRILLILLGLVLTSFLSTGTVHAKNRAAVTFNGSYADARDTELNLENWMVNECYWKCMEFNCLARDFDEALVLEEWMTGIETWESRIYAPVEEETALVLEKWMTGIGAWESYVYAPAEEEATLSLGSWMTDGRFWNRGAGNYAAIGE